MNGQIKHAVSKVTYTKAANGRYRVVNALGQVNILSAEDFLTLYSPVAKVIPTNVNYNEDIRRWAEDTADPFEITEDTLKQDPNSTINTFTKEMKKHIQNVERKHLEPDTIANLIQSNLDNRPNEYSIDAISRTMLGRTGKREPRQ